MPYRIELGKRAQKDLDDLDAKVRQRVLEKLTEMQSDPFKSARKLAGHQDQYRVRVSDWRIVFSVETQVVVIQRVLHRREIYERL